MVTQRKLWNYSFKILFQRQKPQEAKLLGVLYSPQILIYWQFMSSLDCWSAFGKHAPVGKLSGT
jgi:hypothetical protein